MNQFSNSLLSILLSWMRSLFSGFLSLMTGTGGSFFLWMKSRWFTVALVLILAGITIDAIIYILRWQPQRVWRSHLYRLFHRKELRQAEEQFYQGYDDGVTDFTFTEDAIPGILESAAPSAQISDALVQFDALKADDATQPAANVRRRRSERYGRRSSRTFHLRFRSGDIDPSAAQTGNAFHNAVFPSHTPAEWPQNTENQDSSHV